MTDTVLIRTDSSGQQYAHQIWRNTAKSELAGKVTQELLDSMVETADGVADENDYYDGVDFSTP